VDARYRHAAAPSTDSSTTSTLASLNTPGKLREPLTLIYPSDGVVTADYTLSPSCSTEASPEDDSTAARRTTLQIWTLTGCHDLLLDRRAEAVWMVNAADPNPSDPGKP
jgi:hypothetical protein